MGGRYLSGVPSIFLVIQQLSEVCSSLTVCTVGVAMIEQLFEMCNLKMTLLDQE